MPRRNYNWTDAGLEAVELAGLTPTAVWAALHEPPRVFWPISADRAVVYGLSGSQWLVVGLVDAGGEHWDITGARPMDGDEVARFARLRRTTDGE